MNRQITIHRIRSWLFRPTIWIFSLGLLAVFVRLYHLDSVPPGIHFDEIINGEIAANARNEGLRIFYLPGWGREGLYHAFLAASMSLPLPIAWQMRLTAVVISIVGLLLTYGWMNRNFGKWAAVTAVAGLGFSFWSLGLSRGSLRAVTILPLSAGAIWLMLSITKDEADRDITSNKREISFRYIAKILLLAISIGALFYTYRAARVLPVIYLSYLIYLAI